jgi:hypothetical protein
MDYRTKSIQEELAKLAIIQAEEIAGITETNSEKKNEEMQKVIKKHEEVANNFKTIYIDSNTSLKYVYTPAGTFSFLEKDLYNVDLTISTSSIGQKLKRIAR